MTQRTAPRFLISYSIMSLVQLRPTESTTITCVEAILARSSRLRMCLLLVVGMLAAVTTHQLGALKEG